MKKRIISIVSIIFFTVFLISCNSGQTMQEYYVEKQSNNDFISLDLPASIVNLKEDVSPETKEAMQSVKKLNILAFKINDSNKDKYATEYDQVKKILKDEKYNELIRIKHDNVHIVIKYLGDDEEIDEFIFFASDKDQGFCLGENIR